MTQGQFTASSAGYSGQAAQVRTISSSLCLCLLPSLCLSSPGTPSAERLPPLRPASRPLSPSALITLSPCHTTHLSFQGHLCFLLSLPPRCPRSTPAPPPSPLGTRLSLVTGCIFPLCLIISSLDQSMDATVVEIPCCHVTRTAAALLIYMEPDACLMYLIINTHIKSKVTFQFQSVDYKPNCRKF